MELFEPKRQKRTFGLVRPAKIPISLRIRAGWSESSLGAFWMSKDAIFLHTDSDQTAAIQADLSHLWAHMSEGTFPHIAVHFTLCQLECHEVKGNGNNWSWSSFGTMEHDDLMFYVPFSIV